MMSMILQCHHRRLHYLQKKRKRPKKNVITVKHYHYNMDESDGRRRRKRRRSRSKRRRSKRRKRRRRKSRRKSVRSTLSFDGNGLAEALLGTDLGGTRVKHKSGRRRKRRRRRRKKKRKKRARSFGAMLDIDNMADGFFDDSDVDNNVLTDYGIASMNDVFKTMNTENYDIANGQSLKTKQGFAASAWDAENELFDYEYYEFSDNDIADEWYDENEQTQWMVTDIAANDNNINDIWADNTNWEQIDDEIETMAGNKLQRKCMHMWGQRLCLCQFMAFFDNRKFQCQPRNNRFYNPMGPSSQSMMKQSDMMLEQNDKKDAIKKAVNEEKQKENKKIATLNKHYLPIVKEVVEKAKLAEKEKEKIKKLAKRY